MGLCKNLSTVTLFPAFTMPLKQYKATFTPENQPAPREINRRLTGIIIAHNISFLKILFAHVAVLIPLMEQLNAGK